jgi:phage/conjugal plasmid C-4 type zinc finger TraR family protein
MDEADRASDYELRLNQAAIAAHRNQVALAAARGAAYYCGECGEVIPQARREASPGCLNCLPCQVELEHRAQRGFWP